MIQLKPFLAWEITDAIKKAIETASLENDIAQFEFNGVTVRVGESSDPELIYRDWQRGMNGYLGEKPGVGPYPRPELTQAEKDSDAVIKARKDEQRRIARLEMEKRDAEHKAKFNAAIQAAPKMKFKNYGLWCQGLEKNQDGYGKRVYSYAEDWARLMQAEKEGGKAVAECADAMSRLADYDGITGFMYGCAVSILSSVWIHGEELRRWHNLDTQLGTEGEKANEEGGVLNPAILSVK